MYILQTLTRETTVEDINGVSMPAITIFTMAIKYLKEQLLQSLDLSSGFVKETDIQYVLTVPAIWDEKARMFMKEAAVEVSLEW
jgi:molecular chaperone DnaK (HSP70)